MGKTKRDTEAQYAARRNKLLRKIKGDAAIFCAAPEQVLSRDQKFPFRQDSDFIYLTGFTEPDTVLVLLGSTKGPRSILFIRERDPEHERWTGERLGIKRAQRRFNVDEVRPIASLQADLPALLSDSRVLHYSAGANPDMDATVWRHFCSPTGPRLNFPHTIKDARLLTSQMRIVKDREEIRTLRHACDITAEGFLYLAPRLREMKSERHAARVLEAQFARLGGHATAFETIVASGKNATTLHHAPQFQPLFQRELVLIDAGASFNGYAADITRTLPVLGKYSEAQAAVYDVVHEALQEAVLQCGPAKSLDDVHKAAVVALTRGLVRLGVLQGKASQLIAAGAYRPYYMHRTGHWLGLDVHDISPVYCDEFFVPPSSRPLEAGMVFTVEPGLYFDPHDKTIPEQLRGIGVRIEDDVLITSGGCEVLTSKMPTARNEIEELLR